MPEEKSFTQPPRLKVDKNNRYRYLLPNGEEKFVELTDKEINTIENWFKLLAKHKLRNDIENILQVFYELNVTQISHLVKQSKATVARHLQLMEEDGLLLSRKGKRDNLGKYPAKIYRINEKLQQILEDSSVQLPPPQNEEELIEFYKTEILIHRNLLYQFKSLLEYLSPLLDMFEENLHDISAAKRIYEEFFDIKTTRNFPTLARMYYSEKYWDEYNEEFLNYVSKSKQVLTKQNADSDVKEREFVGFKVILPIAKLIEVYKKRVLDKK